MRMAARLIPKTSASGRERPPYNLAPRPTSSRARFSASLIAPRAPLLGFTKTLTLYEITIDTILEQCRYLEALVNFLLYRLRTNAYY